MKSTTFTLSALASLGLVFADGWNDNTETILPNTRHPANGFSTYVSESSVLTITDCENNECAPHVYTVSEPSTLTVEKRMDLSNTTASSASPVSAIGAVSTYEAGTAKLAAGLVGVVGIALLI